MDHGGSQRRPDLGHPQKTLHLCAGPRVRSLWIDRSFNNQGRLQAG
jgi:hypothetical protein